MKERNVLRGVETIKGRANGVEARVYVVPRKLVGMTLAKGAMATLGVQQSMNV